MTINLKEFNNANEYVSLYDHNFKEIDNIQNDEAVNALVNMLSHVSQIDAQICLLDLKNYLMTCLMYYPDQLCFKAKNALLCIRFLISGILKSCKKERSRPIEVLIDDWAPGVMENFYGEELVGHLTSAYALGTINYNRLKLANAASVFSSFFTFVKCLFLARRVFKRSKIDLSEYVFTFFTAFLSGWAMRRIYNPQLIISGHHNGFSPIKAKAAGAKILIIPNGWFGLGVDMAFRYADYFLAIGGKYNIETSLKSGCLYENIYPFGSLRLHNFNQKTKDCHFQVVYDLLWGAYGTNLVTYVDGYYPMEAEREAIRLINKFASRKEVKVAYHCRADDDVENLKKLGLFSENIDYLPHSYAKNPKSVYAAIKESRVVMSSTSSICHEAITLGKKAGFVNLSENRYMNYPYRHADIEYTPFTKITFDEFVEKIKNKDMATEDYVAQNPNYVKDVLVIINEIVEGTEGEKAIKGYKWQ